MIQSITVVAFKLDDCSRRSVSAGQSSKSVKITNVKMTMEVDRESIYNFLQFFNDYFTARAAVLTIKIPFSALEAHPPTADL